MKLTLETIRLKLTPRDSLLRALHSNNFSNFKKKHHFDTKPFQVSSRTRYLSTIKVLVRNDQSN